MGNDSTNFDLNLDWIKNNSTQFRFSPLSISNGFITPPKIGVDKVFNSFTFSAVTDFQHLNFDISDNASHQGKKKLSKSIKVML